ncbi:hypothetical protein [Azohydromonas aeria]|uniref:hypothetical protein n=1 Tax=Azohydromonas aeria TaxID=2590212 RepID=UPI0012F805DF|nr:hypothetical protein [Azohydromonas aeria]
MAPSSSLGVLFALACAAAAAQAAPPAVRWVDWTGADTLGASAGNVVTGHLRPPGARVDVSYTGPTSFVQLDPLPSTDYWSEGVPPAYRSTGRPAGSDLIALDGGDASVHALRFSRPVANPVLAILSLGQAGLPVGYEFTQAPVLLDSGVGYWGGCAGCLSVDGRTLRGEEGHGLIRFTGLVSEISWTAPTFEHWHGFTVGVVPEASRAGLLLAGVLALGGVAQWRRRRRAPRHAGA